MTKMQVEKFAVGYPYPTAYVEILLKNNNYDVAMVHEILCSDYKNVINEVQSNRDLKEKKSIYERKFNR